MSLTEVNKATGYEKRKWDPIATALAFRPVGMIVAAFLLRTSVSADVVSFVGAGILYLSILAAAFLPPTGGLVALGVGMFCFAVGDVVDGALARSRKRRGKLGSWVDGITGYLGLLGFHLGWLLILSNAASPRWVEFLVLISVGANLLLRLVYAKSNVFVGEIKIGSDEDTPEQAGRMRTWFYLLSCNLGVTGFFLPLVLLSALPLIGVVASAFYAFFYGSSLLAGIVYFYRLNAARDAADN